MAHSAADLEHRARHTLRTVSDDELVILLAHALRGDAPIPGVYEPQVLARLIRGEQASRAATP